ncbi:histidine phosphatase family protein [Patescibacteria group bacterium]|nr:histidine phosphatase family protein [Patescibacteria group bacterium]
MQIFSQIMAYLELLANKIPLELFTFLGTILEEMLAPIPSPFVMGITGSIAQAQNKALGYIIVIAIIGAFGRIVGASFLYLISDFAEDIVIGKFGKFIGLEHDFIESIGKKFNGTAKDYITLTVLRAIPIIPSSPISVICGLIKLNFKVFVVGTFIGNIFRNIFFLYIGYMGLSATESFMQGLNTADNIMKILLVLTLIGIYLYYYRKRERGEILTNKNRTKSTSPSQEEIKKAEESLRYKNAEELPKEESDTYPTVYIFRHGQSEDNRDLIFSGWRDSPLTEEGKKQALILAEKLKDKKIDKLISSPQIRAIETMKLGMSLNERAKNLPIEIDERIKERSYGNLQGKNKLEAFKEDEEYLHKVRRTYHGQPEGGESIAMVYERTKNFADELVKEMKEKKINVAISCHGNSIRCFRKYFEGLSDEETATVETQLGQDYAAYVIK